jgi:hypothetical protein
MTCKVDSLTEAATNSALRSAATSDVLRGLDLWRRSIRFKSSQKKGRMVGRRVFLLS